MSKHTRCPSCGSEVATVHPSHHRGILINEIAFLRSRLITDHEMLRVLNKKHYSPHQHEQRDRDLATTLNLQASILVNEARLADFVRIEEECYGQGD